jgi:hypothetical protein
MKSEGQRKELLKPAAQWPPLFAETGTWAGTGSFTNPIVSTDGFEVFVRHRDSREVRALPGHLHDQSGP